MPRGLSPRWRPETQVSEMQSRGREGAVRTISSLIQIFNVGFEEQQVRFAFPIHFKAILVIPLDDALQNFAILEDEGHLRFGLHLFQIVKILGVGLLRRRRSLGPDRKSTRLNS